jgi:SAM-dependent methyltransferase
MSEAPLSDVVSRQYERWTYPDPIADLDVWTRDHYEYFDPAICHRLFWPDRPRPPQLDILIAGCGTNQAAVFAYNNRASRVVAIDISEASLAHEQYLKEKHILSNLELRRMPIEELASLGRDFDLIISTGVLHHIADPLVGMKALASCLRRDGVVALMLYAKYGRVGVEALQSVFRELGLIQDERSVTLVKEIIALLPPDHLMQPYLKLAPDLGFDSGLVDTFLHGRDRSYSVDDCVNLLASAGLEFQGWYFNNLYHSEALTRPGSAVHAALTKLPEPKLWSVMERLQTQNGCHFFYACRPDRPKEQYVFDFAGAEFLEYVPELRHRVRVEDDAIVREDWSIPLSPIQVSYLREVDGRSTIGEMITRLTGKTALADVADPERFARELYQSLWRIGFLVFSLERVRENR